MSAQVQWAQRRNYVLIWCPSPEPSNVVVNLNPPDSKTLTLSWTSKGAVARDFTFRLYDEFAPAPESTYRVAGMGIQIRLKKKSEGQPFWPRFTQDKVKLAHLSVYWSLWKDEDEVKTEEEDDELKNFGCPSPFVIEDGITIGGGGDPDKIAALMAQAQQQQHS
eukprot:PhF_6_TR41116/c0_g1_i1/m.62274